MKKLLYLILMLAIIISAASCDAKEESVSENDESKIEVGSVTDIVKSIVAANGLTEGKTYTSESDVPGEFLDKDMFEGYYGSMFDSPDFTLIDEYCVYIQDKNPLLQIELGIFKVADSNNKDMAKEFIQKRKNSILENAKNYPSVDTEPFSNVIIESVGNYTYYIAVKENRTSINQTMREKLGA